MKSFNVIGKIKIVEGKKKFAMNSPEHFSAMIQRFGEGKELTATFSEKKTSRSRSQLAYHWVLIHYLATHTGYEDEELHDAIMRLKFGTKSITLAGQKIDVRKSVSDEAKFPKMDMSELIEYDLQLCAEMNVKVPSAESLGYIRG